MKNDHRNEKAVGFFTHLGETQCERGARVGEKPHCSWGLFPKELSAKTDMEMVEMVEIHQLHSWPSQLLFILFFNSNHLFFLSLIPICHYITRSTTTTIMLNRYK